MVHGASVDNTSSNPGLNRKLQDDPLGEYRVVDCGISELPESSTDLPVWAGVARSSAVLARVGIGTIVNVVELGMDEGRVRGRINMPHNGWISLRYGSKRFVAPAQETSRTTEDATPKRTARSRSPGRSPEPMKNQKPRTVNLPAAATEQAINGRTRKAAKSLNGLSGSSPIDDSRPKSKRATMTPATRDLSPRDLGDGSSSRYKRDTRRQSSASKTTAEKKKVHSRKPATNLPIPHPEAEEDNREHGQW
jgi:hypothetical protein